MGKNDYENVSCEGEGTVKCMEAEGVGRSR